MDVVYRICTQEIGQKPALLDTISIGKLHHALPICSATSIGQHMLSHQLIASLLDSISAATQLKSISLFQRSGPEWKGMLRQAQTIEPGILAILQSLNQENVVRRHEQHQAVLLPTRSVTAALYWADGQAAKQDELMKSLSWFASCLTKRLPLRKNSKPKHDCKALSN